MIQFGEEREGGGGVDYLADVESIKVYQIQTIQWLVKSNTWGGQLHPVLIKRAEITCMDGMDT